MNRKTLIEELEKREISYSEEKIDLLFDLMNTVLEENKKYNLTAITDENEFLEKMIFDSAILLTDSDINNSTILDMGTGAGFPALVLSILSNNKITALDSSNKKINFIKEFAKLHNLNLESVCERAEIYSDFHREEYDFVTARAMSSLRIIAELGIPALKVGGHLLAYKGPSYLQEIKEAESTLKKLDSHIEKVFVDFLPSNNDERVIIYIVKDKKTQKKYPREYKEIKDKSL